MFALLLLSVACATPNSCADYSAAVTACAKAAGADTTPYEEATVCGDWTAELEEIYGAYYRCQADAFAAGECDTSEGYVAAAGVADECPAP